MTARARGRVLVVEDDHDTAVLLCDALRKRDYQVDHVSSAAACLDWLRSRSADVLLVDVQMAGMSGIELCDELRIRHPDVLAIVLTAQVDPKTADAALRTGAHEVVTKPMRLAVLFATLARAMEYVSRGGMPERDVQQSGSAG